MKNTHPSISLLPRPFLSVILCLAAASCATAPERTEPPFTPEERALNVQSFETAWATIRDKHWDPTLGGLDWQAVHDALLPRIEQAVTRTAYLDAVQELIRPFHQSHFAIVPKNVYQAMQGAGGAPKADGETGIDLRVINGLAIVVRVDTGSPAEAAGVRPGWRMADVDGKRVKPVIQLTDMTFRGKTMASMMRHHAVARLLEGALGDAKRIRFENGAGKEVAANLVLGPAKGTVSSLGNFPVFPVWIESRRIDGDIGCIAFNAFMDPPHVTPAFEQAIQSFMDCKGIIIDIRGNPGGMPIMAMGMAGWLIAEKNQYLGAIRSRDTEIKLVVFPRLKAFQGPVAILIDGSSASCAEIFAGGLRDLGRALVIGERTAGAVLPAQWMELPNGDFFYYPVADYFSKNGDRLEGIGVAPDLEVPWDRPALLEGKDPALDAATHWIREQAPH